MPEKSINQSLKHYFYMHPTVNQRAGKLSLSHGPAKQQMQPTGFEMSSVASW